MCLSSMLSSAASNVNLESNRIMCWVLNENGENGFQRDNVRPSFPHMLCSREKACVLGRLVPAPPSAKCNTTEAKGSNHKEELWTTSSDAAFSSSILETSLAVVVEAEKVKSPPRRR